MKVQEKVMKLKLRLKRVDQRGSKNKLERQGNTKGGKGWKEMEGE